MVSSLGGTTLAQAVYQQVKSMIMSAELLPGEPLLEAELADRLCVSRTPVREALYLLASEGLIEHRTRRGARVAVISLNDVMTAYEAREWVEPEVAAKVARVIDDALLQRLEETLERASADGDTHEAAAAAAAADSEFHKLLLDAAGNRLITQMVLEARSVTERAAYLVSKERYLQSRDEHRVIFEALQQRDPDAARQAMRRHIAGAASRNFGLSRRQNWADQQRVGGETRENKVVQVE